MPDKFPYPPPNKLGSTDMMESSRRCPTCGRPMQEAAHEAREAKLIAKLAKGAKGKQKAAVAKLQALEAKE